MTHVEDLLREWLNKYNIMVSQNQDTFTERTLAFCIRELDAAIAKDKE